MMKIAFTLVIVFLVQVSNAQKTDLSNQVDKLSASLEKKVIDWRRYFHENPELSNREFKTAKKIAEHLTKLGFEVQTEVAHTGVVGILKGGKPGPVVALRADIDGLPVVERVDLSFSSKAKSSYNGLDVGVMHACGHDTHIAILMGVAELMSKIKKDIPGTIVFIFQPAEEGAPVSEEGGAELMVKEGVLKNPDVEAVFGLHIAAGLEVGKIRYKPGGALASSNSFEIEITGKQSHGSEPWSSIDPIVTAAQIINNLQTVVSRSLDLTQEAAVVTIGSIHGGVRSNIIPESVKMEGTIRALNDEMKEKIFHRMTVIIESTAASNGAQVNFTIHHGNGVTYNDPDLTNEMLPTLQRVAGLENVILSRAIMGAEDFSYYQKEVPGLFIFLGGMSKGQDPATAAPHHTPDFFIDESGLELGVRVMSNLALDYMIKNKK